MVNVFYLEPTTSRSTELLLTLPPNVGLVFGACLLIAFGNVLGHWKWTLIVSWTGMTLFGALMGLCTPFNKSTMIAFCCINASESSIPLPLRTFFSLKCSILRLGPIRIRGFYAIRCVFLTL